MKLDQPKFAARLNEKIVDNIYIYIYNIYIILPLYKDYFEKENDFHFSHAKKENILMTMKYYTTCTGVKYLETSNIFQRKFAMEMGNSGDHSWEFILRWY